MAKAAKKGILKKPKSPAKPEKKEKEYKEKKEKPHKSTKSPKVGAIALWSAHAGLFVCACTYV
jgi:hypothetical protein